MNLIYWSSVHIYIQFIHFISLIYHILTKQSFYIEELSKFVIDSICHSITKYNAII